MVRTGFSVKKTKRGCAPLKISFVFSKISAPQKKISFVFFRRGATPLLLQLERALNAVQFLLESLVHLQALLNG